MRHWECSEFLMRDLFERLRDGGEKEIEALKEGRIEEGLHLDFKQKAAADRPGFNVDDKRIFAKALSGFSNSDGGLLVFGVDCREGEDGVDCVQDLIPIINIEKFASDAKNMVSSLINPANDGIEICSVKSVLRPGYGYLLVWVPRSERRPHQSRATGEFKYYRRSGRDFIAMEHYEVEDAMMRRSSPNVKIKFVVETGGLDEFRQPSVLLFKICLQNDGRVTAKAPYLQIGGIRGSEFSHNNSDHCQRRPPHGRLCRRNRWRQHQRPVF